MGSETYEMAVLADRGGDGVVPNDVHTGRPQRSEGPMTSKADFSEEEWKVVLEAPPAAGMVVITAAKGGMMRETWAMSKVYVETRKQHGASELLDAIVASKPEMDHTRYHSPEELKTHCLQHIRDAVALLGEKATAEEVDDFRRFVQTLAERVAAAHKEGGQTVSPAETAAMQEITAALGAAGGA